MSPRPKKHLQTPNLPAAIRAAAWALIAEVGAPALSLRAIARALGITAPAIYNYYPDRDALVTALIVDAFTSLGESQQAAIQDLPAANLAQRLQALGLAYRQWALDYPQRYQLIFGTPLPAYHAPDAVTLPAATRSLQPLIATLQAIHQGGGLRLDRSAPPTPALTAMLSAWSQSAGGAALEALYATLAIWSRVHGLVMLEIGAQLPAFISDPAEIYRREIQNILIQYLR